MEIRQIKLVEKYNLEDKIEKLIEIEVEKRVQKAILEAKKKIW